MIGVDFGGTRIKAAEVREGALVRTHVVDTPPGAAPAVVLDAVAGAVVALEAEPTVFGLAIPGEVDATGRCWRLPNVAGFEGVQISRELGVRTGARVFVENDGTTAALAESLFGHGREHASFLMVTLGGPATLVGPVLGAAIIVLLKNVISAYTARWLLILGIVYIVAILAAPKGLWNLGRSRST